MDQNWQKVKKSWQKYNFPTWMIPVMYRPSLIGAATLVPSMDLFANLLPVDIFLFLLADFCQVKKVFVFFNRQSAAQFPVQLVWISADEFSAIHCKSHVDGNCQGCTGAWVLRRAWQPRPGLGLRAQGPLGRTIAVPTIHDGVWVEGKPLGSSSF